MKTLLRFFTLGLFIYYCQNNYSQNLDILNKSEKIVIKLDSSFTNEIIIKFKKDNKRRIYPIFFDTELEKVSNINLYLKKGKRLKPYKDIRILEENVKLDYISSKKVKYITIPEEEEFHLKYKIDCKELIYFSSLPFFSYNNIDTLNYQIKVPKKFELIHKTILKDSLSFYKIDSTISKEGGLWNIKTIPKKVAHNTLQYFGIYKNMNIPIMKTLIVPTNYKNNPLEYMNNWYLSNLQNKKGLNNDAKLKIDQLTSGIKDKEKIVKIIYNYVKSHFKYVAIEVGMGAFIPSHVNEVFINKQGDCKDLSNFLSEALKYKGIKSDVALASTFDHISDCDFPSLSSANHVIAVVYIDGKQLLLDPTDPIHQQGTPVQSLQDRSILIVNDKGGKFFKTKKFTAKQNLINYKIQIKVDSEKNLLLGDFDVNYKGISDNHLQRIFNYDSKQSFDNFIKAFFTETFGNQEIQELTKTNTSHNFKFKGKIKVNGKTFSDSNSIYVFLDFLPTLIENENKDNLIAGTYIQYPFHKKMSSYITLDKPIEKFLTKTYCFEEKGILLNLNISAISDSKIGVNYDFTFNHIFINKHNVKAINNILEEFKKIINEPIILKRKQI